MSPFEFADKIGGVYNANKVRVVVDGVSVVAAYFSDAEFVITDDGRRALNRAEAETVEEKPQRTKRAKAVDTSASDTPAVESTKLPAE